MAGVADDARFFIRGDEGATGCGAVEGEDEVVEAREFGLHFLELGAQAEGAGFALGDAGLRFGEEFFVFVHFVGEQLEESAGDAVGKAERGGRRWAGRGCGFREKRARR